MAHQNREVLQANNDLNNIFSSASLPVLMLDRNLRIRRFTRVAQDILNVIPTDVGRPLRDLRINIHMPDLQPALLAVLTTGQGREMEVQDPSGHWYSMRIQPYKTGDNKVDGVLLLFVDIDSLKGVEKLQQSLKELQTARNYSAGIVDTVPQPLLRLDAALHVISANAAFYRTFRTSPEVTENQFFYALAERQWDIPQLRTLLGETLSKNTEFKNFEVERSFPQIGQRTMLLNATRIALDGTGTQMILLMIEDITERRRVDDQIKASLLEKEILLKEVHHRVKNNLQIMSSLLKLGSNTAAGGNNRSFVQDSQDRIQAIALVHEQLYMSVNLSTISLGAYFQHLTEHLRRSYLGPENLNITVHGDLKIGVDAAILLGLILNELVTNALKHAFPGGRKGHIRVGLRLESDQRAILEVQDDGVGIPKGLDIEKSDSVGLSLVRQLVNQLKGRLEMKRGPDGATFVIGFPAPQNLTPDPAKDGHA
jgi:two-component system CheB/CheR fusion protein